MSASDPPTAPPSPAPSDAAPAPSSQAPSRPPRRGVGIGGLAMVVALLALIVAGFASWRLWRLHQGGLRDSRALASMHKNLGVLDKKIDDAAQARTSMQQQLQAQQQQGQSNGAQLQSLSERSRSLENAVAGLTAQAESGHDAVRLDEAGMLLQMGAERYALFHDGAGALRAFAMADKLLGEVQNPAYAAVRQTIASERKALAATHPGQRQSDLDTLSQLRAAVDGLPLTSSGKPPAKADQGFWARLGKAFSGLVQIRHADEFTPVRRALARDLVALDLAQAQAALLAWNTPAYHAALARADKRLGHDFDTGEASVRHARAQVARLEAQATPPAAQLGAALQELNNLRAVHDAAAPPAPSPAPAGAHR